MEPTLIAILALQGATIFLQLMKHIKRSKCCGVIEVEMQVQEGEKNGSSAPDELKVPSLPLGK